MAGFSAELIQFSVDSGKRKVSSPYTVTVGGKRQKVKLDTARSVRLAEFSQIVESD